MSLVDGEGDAGAADGSQFALANGQGAGDGHRRTRRHGRRAKQPKHGLAASAAASSEGSGPDAGAVEVVGDSAFMALAEVESGVPEVGVGEGASVIVSTADSAVIEYETGASHTDTVHTLLMHLAHRDRELITMVNRMRATVENRMLSQEEATAAGAQGSGGAAAAARGASAGQGSCGRGKVCDAETPKGFRGVLYRVVRALRCLALCVTRETLRALILIVVAGLLRILLRKYRNRWDWVRYFL
jgi:hypothetical protein